ncbi:methyl-accepting chemotaxis protein [Desulfotruncus alcoholivorax]|uniref:methyl-accepting chemotaxis protein n=1 Tax=Desulfotruncus alcoholivorax TaxID=265477 RepID=UPI0004157CB7|nr:methyl-accepting chemotaxis protein [Desulfotruncus alcoholivorax]
MFFTKTAETSRNSGGKGMDRADFIAAVAGFSLVHTDLITFLAILKVREIAQTALELTSSSQEMAAMTQEVSASVEQINASMQQVAAGAQESVTKINDLAVMGQKSLSILQNMTENAGELSDQIKHIDTISQNVSNIADQTNLLALNAAIEAARAGDAGRGFNVVAEEVRKLAGQTKDAVTNVKQISEQMNFKSTVTVDNVTSVDQNFHQYIHNTNLVGNIIRESTNQIEECAATIENITNAMQQQSGIADNLARASEALSQNCKYISELFRDESGYLNQIIEPCLTTSGNDSVIAALSARLVDHANFLKKTMAEAGKGSSVTGHDECAFGKWYNANREKFGHLKAYQDVDEPHRRVHQAAKELAGSCTAANVQDLMQASALILKAFIDLYHEFDK